MDTTGIIVLIGTIVVFLIFAVGGVTFFLKNRDAYKWPEGIRVTGIYSNFIAHLVYHEDVVFKYTPSSVARRAALAAQSLRDVTPEDEKEYVAKEFIVHVLPDELYNKVYSPKANGMLREANAKAGGKWIPVFGCRESTFGSTPETGSLVVHEMVHNVIRKGDRTRDGDRPHSNPKYWYPTGIEAKAFEKFAEYIKLGVVE